MRDATEHLLERIREADEIHRRTPAALISAGAKAILEIYQGIPPYEDFEIIFAMAYDAIQKRWRKNYGRATLTDASTSIGRTFRHEANDEILEDPVDNWKRSICIGDLVIEALNEYKYINLYFCRGQNAYVIEPTEKWAYVAADKRRFKNITDTPIPGITKLIQSNGRAVIKRWWPADADMFEEYLDKPFIRALDNMQSQAWRLNMPVYKALLRERSKYTKVDYTDDLRKLQTISRASEYRSVVRNASVVRHWDRFYTYVECDYRGRVYYSNPYMNYQGSDFARGLFLFDKPRRVTDKGLKWHARHTACCYNKSYNKSDPYIAAYRSGLDAEGLDDLSVDKMTLADREKWTWDNMDFILETANNLTLHDCEKPVSFLACCLEWKRYHELDNKELFYSALPIPIDGSNNGWQHLAAISADQKAGQLVGLTPEEVPKDFYVKTAKALTKLLPEWFEERDMPMKDIRKGISKRGSMTRAYSAGATKIAENMYIDCRTLGFDTKYNITEKDCYTLARNLIQAIDVVCPGPLQTMKFLQLLAAEDLKKHGEPVLFWESPSGFPVIYQAPRMDKHRYQVRIRMDGKSKQIKHVGRFPSDKPDIKKFMSGISPNFIHSLDAAHMCSVVADWGRAFGGVHDSFSTHADDVDDLLERTKETFIQQYTPEDNNNFNGIKRMLGVEDSELAIPNLGTLDIMEIRKSDYFFA